MSKQKLKPWMRSERAFIWMAIVVISLMVAGATHTWEFVRAHFEGFATAKTDERRLTSQNRYGYIR